MINLKPALDQDVLLQFKRGVYVVANAGGRLIPLSGGDQSNPGPPLVVDRLEGRLRMQDEALVLTYANPANPADQMDYIIDQENVAGCWVQRRVQIITGSPGAAPVIMQR